MTTYPITLSTTEPNNYVGTIKVRQYDSETQIFDLSSITENGVPIGFEGLTPFFCVKASPLTGLGISEQIVTDVVDAKSGRLRYTLTDYDMQRPQENYAYFSFRKLKDDLTWEQQFSTKDFKYVVIPSIHGEIHDSNYIWTFEEMLRQLREWIDKAENDFNEWNEEKKNEILLIIQKFKTWILENQADYDKWLEDNKDTWAKWVEDCREILESVDPGGVILTELIDARGEFNRLKDRLEDQDKQINSKRRADEPKAGFTLNNEFRYQRPTNDYCVPQGFCSTKDSFLIIYNDHYIDGRTETENCLLQEVSSTTGEILRENEVRVGHGNGLAYRVDTNEILCVAGFMLGNENREVIVIDYETLTIKGTFPTSFNFTAISYDDVSHRIWAKSDKTVCELSLDDYSVLKQFTITTNSIGQDICAYNNYLYLPLSNPESIMIIDDEGKLIQNYAIPRYSGDNTYINELEGAAHVKDNQFALISFNFSSLSKKSSEVNIFMFDPLSQEQIERRNFANYPNARVDYYVDSSYTGFDSNGTQTRPFKTLNQCFGACANASFMYTINVVKGNYPFAELSMVQTSIEINGNGATIAGIAFNRISRLSLSNLVVTNEESTFALTIDNISTVKLINVETKMINGTKCARFFDSSVAMDSCTITGEGIVSNNTHIYEVNTTANTETAFSVSNRSTLNFTKNELQSKIDVGNGSAKLAVYPPTIVFSRSSSDNRLFGYAKINRKIFNEFLLTFNVGTTLMSQETINARDTDSMVRFSEVANTAGDLIMYELRLVQTYDSKELLKDIQITESRKTTFKQDGTRTFTNWTSGAYPDDLPFISSVRVFS
ncbi:BppU family phage baseplate upper protein [Enterococcus sp. BWM-S5]|uniref:BppU family phage baseplate upper protein n=1 Tax=Enterococcus larvae TaxID=2794352 RepID=A0ABS4CHC9_9ENTE|nr:phage baseplate upper protein [Enterococcus larvae]MBP1045264.1 BppU family phage baseplate upper protein [Enterococcus larvae]